MSTLFKHNRSEWILERNFRRKLMVGVKTSPWPGIGVCGALAGLAMYLHTLPYPPFTTSKGNHPINSILVALLLGMALRNLIPASKRLKPGFDLVVKKILPIGIILLGARLDLHYLLQVNLDVFLSILGIILAVLLLTSILGHLMGVGGKLSLLIGVGTAICGSSAIVVTAPVLDASDSDLTLSLTTINLMGVFLMLLFPILGSLMGLGAQDYGTWCGLSIHATPQVLAAGFAHHLNGQFAGEISTIVKLTRISLLGPTIFVIGTLYFHRQQRIGPTVKRPVNYWKLFPRFVLFFFGMSLLKTLGFFPEITLHMADHFSLAPGDHTINLGLLLGEIANWIIIGTMVGVGLMTDFRNSAICAPKAFSLSLVATAIIALLGLIKINL